MESDNVSETINEMQEKVIENMVWDNIKEDIDPTQWDADLIKKNIEDKLGLNLPIDSWIEEENFNGEELQVRINDAVNKLLDEKRKKYGIEIIQNVEKQLLLQTIDKSWRDHLLKLEHLRSVIGFRGYAQRDPLNEYKSEAYELFEVLLQTIGEDVTKFMAFFHLVDTSKIENKKFITSDRNINTNNNKNLDDNPQRNTITTNWGKIGRNSPCPCGSGKKFKNCHGKN